MKQTFVKGMLIAAVALLTVPSIVLAQQEKTKDKDDKKNMETIIITRKGDLGDKAVIELNGDKVIVNGKEVKEGDKDAGITVHRNKFSNSSRGSYAISPGNWSFNFDDDGMSLFDEDNNRAMLGVVTEGDEKGAEILSITKESAAEKAGLKKGDIITKIGTKKIESTDDVTAAIKAHKPGEKIDINYLRDGKEQKATAELGKWKGIRAVTAPRVNTWTRTTPPNIDMAPVQGYGSGGYAFTGRPKLGLSIQDTDDGKGVKILEVDEESNAAKAGLKQNDIILSIDDKEVKGTDDVTKTLRADKDKYTYKFKIQRGSKTETVEVKLPRKLKTADL